MQWKSVLRMSMVAIPVMIVFGLLVPVSSIGPTARADNEDTKACSNKTHHGDYGFALEGEILGLGFQVRGVVMQHYEGEGSFTQVDHVVINGEPHGPEVTTTCQLHMRSFKDGDKITIEPWRSTAFPVLKDLCVDRSAFDRIIQQGGYISVNTGAAPEAHSVQVPKDAADRAFDVATCIGCGACVAACRNASAMLFVAAKVSHLAELPQGKVEAKGRAQAMVAQMDQEGFGHCTNQSECQAVCPKEISVDFIAELNREYLKGATRSPSSDV